MPDDNEDLKRTERLQVMLDEAELTKIDDWRFEHRIPSRAAAIRELIRRGMLLGETGEDDPSVPGSGDMKSTAFRAIPSDDD